MTTDDLKALWDELKVPRSSQALAGRPAPGLDPERGVLLALDRSALRHILVPTSTETTLPRGLSTKGLSVSVDELAVGDRPPRHFIDIQCLDESMEYIFAAVADEIIEALLASEADSLATVKQVLARWKWFWAVPPSGLSDDAITGLFGELWFLEYWLGGVTDRTLAAWRGPLGDRHDFRWGTASVEVKATKARSDGAAKHRISTLDQLEDPAQGSLYLFSLRVRPDALAAHSLTSSVDRLRHRARGSPGLLASLDELLGRVGYSPAHRDRYGATVHVVAEELYRVEEGFPRLTSVSFERGVPAGVEDIAYALNLAACQRWLIATRPTDVDWLPKPTRDT